MIRPDILNLFRLQPGKKVRLKDHDTGWAQTKELKELGKDVVKDRAKEILDKNLEDLAEAQELLYADDCYAVLIVLQAMDAAGKDGTTTGAGRGVGRDCPVARERAARRVTRVVPKSRYC
jgi:polyphosphate kinase 2 (PPK2 family)